MTSTELFETRNAMASTCRKTFGRLPSADELGDMLLHYVDPVERCSYTTGAAIHASVVRVLSGDKLQNRQENKRDRSQDYYVCNAQLRDCRSVVLSSEIESL